MRLKHTLCPHAFQTYLMDLSESSYILDLIAGSYLLDLDAGSYLLELSAWSSAHLLHVAC
jgi:hypothetical protein